MIQRIQTIFMAIIAFLCGIMMYLNLVSISFGNQTYDMTVWNIKNVDISTWPIGVLNIIIFALTVISIFLYKKRIIQIRLNTLNILLSIGIYLLILFYYLMINKYQKEVTFTWHFIITIPFINIVLSYLAIRFIGKDEAMIRSLNHLR